MCQNDTFIIIQFCSNKIMIYFNILKNNTSSVKTTNGPIFNGLPIVRKWSDIKVNNKMFKMENVVKSGSQRLCHFPSRGYVLLCSIDHCKGLITDNNLCKNHNKEIESYSYCRHQGCQKQASFGFEYTKSLYCSAHKLNGMVDVKSKKCKHSNCKTQRVFGYEGDDVQFIN